MITLSAILYILLFGVLNMATYLMLIVNFSKYIQWFLYSIIAWILILIIHIPKLGVKHLFTIENYAILGSMTLMMIVVHFYTKSVIRQIVKRDAHDTEMNEQFISVYVFIGEKLIFVAFPFLQLVSIVYGLLRLS